MAKTRKNPGKRFVTCSKYSVYDFLDDDLPSEYYKELLYGMFQKQKQSKKHTDYEQVINVLAREKSMCKEELRATKSKLKLYDSLKGCLVNKYFNLQMQACKCKLQMQAVNACCKCLLANTCLQMQAENACLQMQVANERCKCMLACKCKLQMKDANACLLANASCK
ncbi:hypothetical protein Tco_0964972 [Tanacetum coccineum]